MGARRAMTSEGPARAVVSLVRRNRRRYGGYTVHLGMAVLFVGVAASSAFQHARDVRLTPGQTATVGGYQVNYVRSTARVDERDGGVERVALGADLRVRKDGSKVARPAHRARLLPVGGAVRLRRARARAVRGRGHLGGRDEGRARCATCGP